MVSRAEEMPQLVGEGEASRGTNEDVLGRRRPSTPKNDAGDRPRELDAGPSRRRTGGRRRIWAVDASYHKHVDHSGNSMCEKLAPFHSRLEPDVLLGKRPYLPQLELDARVREVTPSSLERLMRLGRRKDRPIGILSYMKHHRKRRIVGKRGGGQHDRGGEP